MTIAAIAELGVTQECVDAIRLALSEACTNVISHSDADDEYEVKIEIDDAMCTVRVIDSAHGFDGGALSAEFPNGDATSGRGIALMHALMDSIAFESTPEAGTIVHLIKRLDLTPDGALHMLGQ